MAFVCAPAQASDINSDWIDLLFDTFGGYSPLNNALHQENMTPAGRERALKFFQFQFARPESRFVKVTKGDELVGLADYEVMDLGGKKFPIEALPAPAGNWDTPDDEAWAQAMIASLLQQRNKIISEKPQKVISLIRMVVKPQYQRQGVGRLLMKYGVDLADSMNAEMTVEASPNGKLLYQQYGYIDPFPNAVVLEVPEKFADKPKQPLFFLHRKASAT